MKLLDRERLMKAIYAFSGRSKKIRKDKRRKRKKEEDNIKKNKRDQQKIAEVSSSTSTKQIKKIVKKTTENFGQVTAEDLRTGREKKGRFSQARSSKEDQAHITSEAEQTSPGERKPVPNLKKDKCMARGASLVQKEPISRPSLYPLQSSSTIQTTRTPRARGESEEQKIRP
ncbi:hypothetical protein TNCV_1080591 [Trichonephila clavipes]|nr:hypothetical protein TNCV_1080591 [Trichonephila clavipes]